MPDFDAACCSGLTVGVAADVAVVSASPSPPTAAPAALSACCPILASCRTRCAPLPSTWATRCLRPSGSPHAWRSTQRHPASHPPTSPPSSSTAASATLACRCGPQLPEVLIQVTPSAALQRVAACCQLLLAGAACLPWVCPHPLACLPSPTHLVNCDLRALPAAGACCH